MKLSPNEWKKLEALFGQTKADFGDLEKGLGGVEFDYIKDFTQKFDGELFEEFMQEFAGKFKFLVNQKNLAQGVNLEELNTPEKIAKKLGSVGVTLLIEDLLDGLEEWNAELQATFLSLVACRNEMQTAEQEYLDGKYRKFLESKLG